MVDLSLRRRIFEWFRRHWPSLLFVLAALGVWACVSWDAAFVRMVTWEDRSDYWEHSATLHALIENPWHPRHPHLSLDAGSPRFGPQFILVALIARALHLDPIQAMALAAVLNTLLLLGGIRAFFLTYFRHPLAPLYAVLVMFGGWWHGFHYSNVYSLPVLLAVASFPSTTALGLTLLGFTLVVRVLRGQVRRKWLALIVLGVWAAAVFIIHPLTAMMSVSGALLLPLSDSNVTWRLRFELAGAVLLGCVLSHFWPYFSPWVVLRGGHGHLSNWAGQGVEQAADLHVKKKLHLFYDPHELFVTLGMNVATLVMLPYFFFRRSRWWIGLGALGMLVPFVANVFVEIPLGHRFVLLAIVFLHIGLVSLLLRLTPGHLGTFGFLRRRALGFISALLVVATLAVFCVHTGLLLRSMFGNPRYAQRRESPVVQNMRAFADAAGTSAVVLANQTLSWPLPTFGPKVLLLFHDDPLVPDELEREHSVWRFLAAGTSDDERRAILARYGVSHVLVKSEAGSVSRFLSKTASLRAFGNGYRLYTLSPHASSDKP